MSEELGRGVSGAAGTGADDDLVITGRLEESSFADLLTSLSRSRETARVILRREGMEKVVHVLDGRIVFASSSDPDERLGESLLREGGITIEQYEHSARLIRPGRRQGTILVELGYITPNELVKGVKAQVEHVVAGLFRWRAGDYRIEIGEFDQRDMITLNISTENLVFSGIKAGAGWSQVMRGLGGSLETVLDRCEGADTRLYKLDLSDEEAHVYQLAGGRLNVAQLCAMSYSSNYDTCLTLWALVCCGILRVVTSKDAESLFREQVAEFELHEIRDVVADANARLATATRRLESEIGSRRVSAFLEEALAEVIDEHHDVLRDLDVASGSIDPDLVVENALAIEAGLRKDLVEGAMRDLVISLLLRVRLEVSAELEQEIARDVSNESDASKRGRGRA